MDVMQKFLPLGRISLLLVFIVMAYASTVGASQNPLFNQQVPTNSNDYLKSNRTGYTQIPQRRDLNSLTNVIAQKHQTDVTETLNPKLIFRTFLKPNVREKRDADNSTDTSLGTPDSLPTVSGETVTVTATDLSETVTSSLEPTTEVRVSSESPATATTVTSLPQTLETSTVLLAVGANDTANQIPKDLNTTSSVCPQISSLMIVKSTPGKIVIIWSLDPENADNFRNICVEVSSVQNGACKNYQSCFTENVSTVTVSGLCHYTEYTVSVKLQCDNDEWNENTQTVKTKESVPSEPTNLKYSDVMNTSIALAWSEPTSPNGEINQYTVYWKSDVMKSRNVSDTFQTLDGLKPFTEYSISVSAWTKAGEGNETSTVLVRTKEGIPSAPKHLVNGTVTNTTIALEWSPPDPTNGAITQYIVYWEPPDSAKAIISQGTAYKMENLQPYTNYTILVSAWTIIGESEKKAGPLTIQTEPGIPDPPRELRITEVSNQSLTLQWLEPNTSNGVIIKYSAYWKKSNSMGDFASIETNETGVEVGNLMPYTNYTVKVSAWTVVGEGAVSEEITQQTAEETPDPPEGLEFREVTKNKLTLRWFPPSVVKGVITKYTVYWKELDSTDKYNEIVTNETILKLENLKPFTNYIVQISAWTVVGEGPKSEENTQQTSEGTPGPPLNLKIQEGTNISLTLSWSPPKEANGIILKYDVTWISSGDNNLGATNETFFDIDDLIPYTNYTISVVAWTSAGKGVSSDRKYYQTDVGVPSKPKNVSVIFTTADTLILRWENPEDPRGPVDGYIISWKLTEEEEYPFSKDTNSGEVSTYEVKGLKPFTNYTLQVTPYNTNREKEILKSENSTIIQAQTAEGIPTEPINLENGTVKNTTIALKWSPSVSPNGKITYYTIYWSSSNGEDSGTSQSTSYIVRKLKPYTLYTISVSASTAAGESVKRAGPLKIQTEEGIPSAPRDFHVVSFTNTTFHVAWNDPETPNGIILVYTVHWLSENNDGVKNYMNTTSTSYVIPNLNPFTNYNITVSATTIAGEGPTALEKVQRTDVGAPSAPQNGTVLYVNDTTIILEWRKPEVQNGPIDGFTVCWRKYFSGDNSNTTVTEVFCESCPAEGEACDTFNGVLTELLDDSNATLSDCQYGITDLDPWTNYTIDIKAYNKNQNKILLEGPSQVIQQATTAAVPVAPDIHPVHVLSSTTVSVTWTYSGRFPGPLTYAIYLRTVSSDTCIFPENRNITENLKNGTANIFGLRPFTSYDFRVFASTPAGSSRSRLSDPVKTKPDVPEQPSNVRVNCNYSPTKASISWKAPSRENGLIEEYKIRYKTKNAGQNYEEVTKKVNDPKLCDDRVYQHELQNLHPEMPYEISVMGKTKDVDSYGVSATSREYCILPAGVPPFPSNDTLLDVKDTNEQEVKLVFSEDTFSIEMGEIRYYAVIVAFSHVIGKPRNGSTDDATKQKLPVWNQFWKQEEEIYQATPENWNPFQENDYDPLHCQRDPDSEGDLLYCTIGWEKNCSEEEPTYCNGPLKPGKRYGIKLRGFTAGGFSETSPIYISTSSIDTSSPVGTIVGLVFVFLLAILLAVAVFVDKRNNYKIFNRIRDFFRNKEPATQEQNVEIVLNDVSPTNDKIKPMDFVTFLDHVKVMMSDSFLRFSLEYEEIKQNSPKNPCTAAEMEENRGKNRWMNIFPYDRSRVKLLPIDDEPSSDYINANYIPGFNSHREYIATQGPLPNTIDDFWRMVWEQGVTMIVMLTQCVERGKKKM